MEPEGVPDMEPEGVPGMEPEVVPGMKPEAMGQDRMDAGDALEWERDPVTGSKFIATDSYWTEQDVKDGKFDRFGLFFYTGMSLADACRKWARYNAIMAKQEQARKEAEQASKGTRAQQPDRVSDRR